MDYFDKNGLDLKKLLSITTDGAPAMVGTKKRLVHLLNTNAKCNKNLISYHCIIHQTALYYKLNPNLESIMREMIKIVNFLWEKSLLKHREMKYFLDQVDAQYDDLLLHNNVRWFSKGYILQRFFSILEDLKTFLFNTDQTSANAYLSFFKGKRKYSFYCILIGCF